jgi:PKD repeat protein
LESESDEIVIRLDWKHLIVIVFIVILAISTVGTYVNAMISYRPNTISAYVSPPPLPPPNKVPVSDAGPNQEIFVNETVQFDGSKSKDEDGSIKSYTWTFGDGQTATGVKVTHSYASPGTYTVTLKVTDDKNSIGTDTATVTVYELTPETISTLPLERLIPFLEEMPPEASTLILTRLNMTLAQDIAGKMNTTKLKYIIEKAVDLNQTFNISRILLRMRKENATGLLINLDLAYGARIIESMNEINVTECARLVENAVSSDPNRTADILELVETQTLLEVLIEITSLPFTPSTAATILDTLSTEKAIELIKAWITTEDIQELGNVFQYLPQETLNNLYGSLEMAERATLYPFLLEETISLIQARLLPLPDIALTSLTIKRLGSRGYHVNATIENLGNTGTGAFSIEFTVDGNVMRQVEFQDLPTENSTVTFFEWRPTGRGVYTLTAMVDPMGIIDEIDETNNNYTRTYGVELPDLTVAFRTAPSELLEKKPYTLEVEVSNIGEEAAEDFNLTMQGSGIIVEKGQVKWISFTIGSSTIAWLQAGTSEVIGFEWKPETAGAYTLSANADPSELILEGDRTNNEATMQIEIEKGPEIWPYLLIGAVMAMTVLGILLLTRPQIFSPLTRLLRKGK